MAKTRIPKALQPVIDLLTETAGLTPRLTAHGKGKRQVLIAQFDGYPSAKLVTFVTVGLSQEPVTMHRGLDAGFELTLTLAQPASDSAKLLAQAALENLKIVDADERRPFIEYNGVYAPGYALTCCSPTR
ncbi:MAG: suppressor of fused domain protein [Phycisphaerales bacterium]